MYTTFATSWPMDIYTRTRQRHKTVRTNEVETEKKRKEKKVQGDIATVRRSLLLMRVQLVGRDSSVGIATHYWLDGPVIESRWGHDFLHPSRTVLGPT